MRRVLLVAAAATAALLTSSAPPGQAANPGTATTSTGQTLNVLIDAPVNGAGVQIAPLPVAGVAGLGTLGTGAGATAAYAVDNSGSTSSPSGLDCNGDGTANAGDNFNGDSRNGDVLDCEIAGVVALHGSIASTGAAVGLVAFGSSAAKADVSPAPGEQLAVRASDDANQNGVRDVEEAARTITNSGIGQFTAKSSGGGTDFNAALTEVESLFSGGGVAFFLSDGQSSVATGPGSPLENAKAKGIKVNTYSIGSGAAGCATGSTLRTIADTTGGTCTEAADPSKLAGTLAGAPRPALAGIDRVELTLRGQTIPASFASGAFTGTFPATALQGGPNVVQATAIATDGTRATADVTVNVAGAKPSAFGPNGIVTGMPSTRRCVSRRSFRIRIRERRGRKYTTAQVFVNRKQVAVRRGKRITAAINLRGLPKGRYTVKIVVVTTTGEIITGTRRYRTCTKKEIARRRIPLSSAG